MCVISSGHLDDLYIGTSLASSVFAAIIAIAPEAPWSTKITAAYGLP